MKKSYFFLLAAAMMVSCSENDITTPQKPSNPGSEVNFTLRLDNADLSTRTIYGDEEGEVGSKVFPIFWVEGDQVTMASPQATVKNATYAISVGVKEDGTSAEDQNFASAMTKIGAAGIQWGAEFPQNFYSIYPAKYTDVNDKVMENTISTDDPATPVATLHIRDTQKQLFTKSENTNIWKGTPVDENGMKSPDAIMYAQKQMMENGDVILKYVPLATAFSITLDGYDFLVEGEATIDPSNPIVIQEVRIEAPDGVQLAGDFKATFDANATQPPVVKEDPDNNSCKTPNIIHVPCMVDETNYLHPQPGDKIQFNVFAILDSEKQQEVSKDWKLHVQTNYKTYTRTLNPTNATSGALIPGRVHRLKMPAIQIGIPGHTTLNYATWMKSIPRNVYITDISLPGAWYARQAEYQGTNSDGTGWTIQGLWNKGVRAFSVETRSCTGGLFQLTPTYVGISGTGHNSAQTLGLAHFYGATNVSDVMQAVCDAVNGKSPDATEKTSGFAILTISYADGGTGGHRQRDYNFWLQGLYEAYNSLPDNTKATIYGYNDGEKITPATTIGDVAGRVILRVNVASGLPGKDANQNRYPCDGMIHKGNYDGQLPALLTYVNRQREPGTAPVSEMHWKEWDDSYMTNVGIFVTDNDNEAEAKEKLKELGPDKFYCNYSVANRTYPSNNSGDLTQGNIPTYTARKQALSRILRNSALSLELGNHNLWSLFAAGGTQTTSSTSKTTDPIAYAVEMNQWILDQLNDRINSGKYGPFGNVFCNYIANNATSEKGTVDGTQIIERILRMNQLFRLSRDEDKPEWPDKESGTTTPSAANYSSSLSKDENGWNAF